MTPFSGYVIVHWSFVEHWGCVGGAGHVVAARSTCVSACRAGIIVSFRLPGERECLREESQVLDGSHLYLKVRSICL